ncbi:MAG TPA: vanadium-dependent haloperoxidase [Flavisolibacter sp.]|nr:vanadium-dependent haloperoxidase [Flavisolibacter sp.]
MKRNLKLCAVAGLALALITTACNKNSNPQGPHERFSNEVILKWNEVAYEAFGGATYQHSLMASRINAMMHLAVHDAVNGIEERYSRYAFAGKDAGADPVAAAASAAHTVLLAEMPAKKGFLDSALAKSLSTVYEGEAKSRGVDFGKQAAQSVLSKRANDGSNSEVIGQVPPSSVPGVYQAVPPFNILFAPDWENVKLFSLNTKDQFRSAPHPALNSVAYATAFNEVKEVGKLNSGTRSQDQTAFAKFWYEFSEAGWNRVARITAVNKKLDLFETARLLALVDMAIADAYIAGWDSKFHYNFWRPYTAIRNAATDNNNATAEDAQWEPSEPTPPVQDYPSTHSALGNAAATVLAKLTGDNTAFTMTSPTAFPLGTTRSFTSFSQAANENAESRVMAGIHFRFSCVAGQDLGTKIGKWTVENHLKPLK